MDNAYHTEQAAPRTARNTVRIALVAGALAVLWAQITELPEIAFAKGTIQPTGSLRRVEHLDGGVVESIFVREGDIVTTNDNIVRLNDVEVETELENLRVRERVLTQALDRNRRVLTAIGFNGWVTARDVSGNQRAQAQTKSYEASRLRLHERVKAAKARILAGSANIANLEERHMIEDNELARVRILHTRGLSGDERLYESEMRANTTTAELLAVREDLTRAHSDHADAAAALDEYYARFRDTLLADIEATMEELTLVQRAVIAGRLRRDRLIVNTPVQGVVQALYLSAAGEVVEPGGLVAEVLPTTETLIAELQIKPRDIGHIALGDPVEINLTTFNVKQYGVMVGWVSQISPTSTENEQREKYYLVRVQLEAQNIGDGDDFKQLKAGMEVNASIKTGNRTAMDYLLAPIVRPFKTAFNER